LLDLLPVKLNPYRLLETLRHWPAAGRYHLAFSGGLDSTVLLHLLAAIRSQLPGELLALHVHHGLQAEADAWGTHCERLCLELDLPLRQLELELSPRPGESLEAVAREARYAALATALGEGEMLLSAQHQDDQAETLLLQMLRGSGPAGLAAMPRLASFGSGWLGRPLLDSPRSELEAYARSQRLHWVEDPSNRSLRFDRNFIRHRVMPLLRKRWPAAAATMARSARLSSELQTLVDEQAARDLEAVRGGQPASLSIRALRELSSPRIRSLLRHWVREEGGSMPGSRHLQRIEQECLGERADAQPLVHWGDTEVRRYRDELFLLRPLPPHDPSQVIPWRDGQPLKLPTGLGALVLESAHSGASRARWFAARVEVRFRQGGERCVPAGSAHHRPLKKLLQEWGVPPWERDRLPLIYLDGVLAVIPGHLCCEPFRANQGEPAVLPRLSRL
jgi:tRNA(Ile)-lysidine synthase